MTLHAKIGTLSSTRVRTYRIRKLPVVGQVFYVYEHERPIRVRLTQVIGRPGSDALYLLERL